MDLETENRIASILLKEAAELRRQADKEGPHAYLRKPEVRGRPNSRFLTATVLGVQQANRAVDVNEMWRLRQKERELDNRLKGSYRNESSSSTSHKDILHDSSRSTSKRHADSETNASASCSSSKRVIRDCYLSEEACLKDDEVEEFLHSRVKRGRGSVGSRMDETGPYRPSSADVKRDRSSSPDVWFRGGEHRVVLGPEKPPLMRPCKSSEEESIQDRRKKKKAGSGKQHSKKHCSKEKSKDKKKKRKEEKRCRRHK